MKLRFYCYYDEVRDRWRPTIEVDKNSKHLNAFLLYLDELASNLDFANDIVAKLDANRLYDIDFSSNYWGVDIIDEHFKIHFFLDEENLEWQTFLTKAQFRTAIFNWIEFLKIPPHEGYEKLIDIN